MKCTWSCGSASPWVLCTCGGGGCFLAGTPITMADGTTKPIESVRVGDAVLVYDESTSSVTEAEVTGVYEPFMTDSYYVINNEIRATGTQPLLVNGGWVDVSELRAGLTMSYASGKARSILTIERIQEPVLVYNIEIGSLSTYIAHGVIAHNKPPEEYYSIKPQ